MDAERELKAKRDRFGMFIFSFIQMMMILMVIISLDFTAKCYYPEMNFFYIVDFALDVYGMAVLFFVFSAICRSWENSSRITHVFSGILICVYIELFLDVIAWCVQGSPEYVLLNRVDNFLVYIFGVLITYFFYEYFAYICELVGKLRHIFDYIVRSICLIDIILIIANLFNGMFYTINSAGEYIRNDKTFIVSVLSSAIVLIIDIYVIFSQKLSKRIKGGLVSYVIILVVSVLIQVTTFGLSIQYPGIALSLVVIYCNVQTTKERELIDAKAKVIEQNNIIMLSQIQPHFMYNTLATIKVLVSLDPALAEETLDNFSAYLRGNITALKNEALVPIEREIEHTKYYTNIEKLRFDDITIEYDIQDTHFMMPVLSIQPLVENAIKHGVRGVENGKVTIRTEYVMEDKEKWHKVTIEDNGIGFEIGAKPEGPGTHIGMTNVQHRIESLSHGKFVIDSQRGKGTTISIYIPS